MSLAVISSDFFESFPHAAKFSVSDNAIAAIPIFLIIFLLLYLLLLLNLLRKSSISLDLLVLGATSVLSLCASLVSVTMPELVLIASRLDSNSSLV